MPDQKISVLTALATTPAAGDLLPIVDTTMAASGTKKITYTNLTGDVDLGTHRLDHGFVELEVVELIVADDEHEWRYQFVVEKFKPSPHVRILRQTVEVPPGKDPTWIPPGQAKKLAAALRLMADTIEEPES